MKSHRKFVVAALLVGLLVGLAAGALLINSTTLAADAESQPMLAHMVYFSLKDKSPQARQALIDSCKKYLADHGGVEYFSVGTLSDLKRDVNDRDFDVALHLVFKDRAAHDRYQTAPKHEQFVAENKPTFAKVRVFDSDLQ